jgi:hypothetical protein
MRSGARIGGATVLAPRGESPPGAGAPGAGGVNDRTVAGGLRAVPAARAERFARADVGAAAALGLLSFGLYLAAAWHLAPYLGALDHRSFGGDTATSARAMLHPAFEWKHPLFSPVTWPLVALLQGLLGLSPDASVRVVLALLAAANVILMYALLRRFVTSRLLSIWFSVLYALLGVNLLIFGIPETYSTSNLAILAYLLAFAAVRHRVAARDATTLGALAGIASLCNPPLLSLLGIHTLYAARRRGLRAAAAPGVRSLLVALAVFAAANVLTHAVASGDPLWFLERSTGYAERYASWSHFADLRAVATVGGVFLLSSVIAPMSTFLQRPSGHEMAAYLGSPGAALFVLVYAGWGLYVVARCIGGRDVLGACLMAWIAGLLLFYVYWNPPTATRFSPQILAPLTLVLARPFASHARGHPAAYATLGAASGFLAVHNLVTVFAMG